MLHDLILKNRSYRRFHQEVKIERPVLEELLDLARLSASGGNIQPLKFILSCDPERNAKIFPQLGWGSYIKDWVGPAEGERPSAYIVILGDTGLAGSFGCDYGIAAQSILLGATERGLGGCMIESIQRDQLRVALSIAPKYRILLVIALGQPAETVVIEPLGAEGDVRYWRDSAGIHHVPKRALQDLIVNNGHH
jgi:nitroreductase